jgi:acyl carrier protein
MDKLKLWETVATIFHETLDRDDLILTPFMSAKNVPEWDSLSHILLVVAVEKKFGIKFNTGEIETLENVGQFIDLIASKVA